MDVALSIEDTAVIVYHDQGSFSGVSFPVSSNVTEVPKSESIRFEVMLPRSLIVFQFQAMLPRSLKVRVFRFQAMLPRSLNVFQFQAMLRRSVIVFRFQAMLPRLRKIRPAFHRNLPTKKIRQV